MAAIVYSNAVGKVRLKEGYDDAIGQSQIAMPVLGVIGRMDEEEGMLIENIDMGIIGDARRAYGIRDNRKA